MGRARLHRTVPDSGGGCPLILEAVVPSGSVKEAATGWSLNVPSLDDMKFTTPNFSLIGSADLFGAFTHIGPLAASLLVFTILLSVFFDAMGVMTICQPRLRKSYTITVKLI